MNKKLKETYKFKFGDKTSKIQIFEILEDGEKNVKFIAISDYKRIVCESDTFEKVKEECEREIEIKADIALGKIKLLDSKKAEEIAKNSFKKFLENYNLPANFDEKISVGFFQKGKEWIFVVHIHQKNENNNGLFEDLIRPKPELLAEIRVDGETGEAIVLDNKEVVSRVLK